LFFLTGEPGRRQEMLILLALAGYAAGPHPFEVGE
jgi:hypothetical protein